MKTLALPAALLLFAQVAFGFDPAGPPPTKTVQWTIAYMTSMIVPRVDFDETVPLAEGLDFLQLRNVMPAAYGIEIDGTALGEPRLKLPIQFKAQDLKLIDILASLADSLDANLIIERGKVRFVPKK
jgi:hypothetical protein